MVVIVATESGEHQAQIAGAVVSTTRSGGPVMASPRRGRSGTGVQPWDLSPSVGPGAGVPYTRGPSELRANGDTAELVTGLSLLGGPSAGVVARQVE